MRGFTLIELLVTIAVLALLAAIAVPSYNAFVINARTAALANDFSAAVALARSSAMQRSEVIRLEPQVAGGDWVDGWQVVRPSQTPVEVIKVWTPAPIGGRVVDQPNGPEPIVFGPLGDRRSIDSVSIVRVGVEGCRGDRARELRIRGSGHVEINPFDCASLP
ncbi:MAG: GspH/FimT family pseudopilin [Thioalkalivibrionaceae bacterium]